MLDIEWVGEKPHIFTINYYICIYSPLSTDIIDQNYILLNNTKVSQNALIYNLLPIYYRFGVIIVTTHVGFLLCLTLNNWC